MMGINYFSLKDMMSLGAMAGHRVLCCGTGVERPVCRTNVVESADLAAWANADEAILTSGYQYRNRTDLLLSAVEGLAQKKAAALCIKPSRFYSIPFEAVQKAEELGLALIELPMEAIFSNIVHETSDAILQRRIAEFSTVQSRTEDLLDILLSSDSIESSLDKIEGTLKNPLMVFTHEKQLIMSVSTREQLGSTAAEELLRILYHAPRDPDIMISTANGPLELFTYRIDASNQDSIELVLLRGDTPIGDDIMVSLRRISQILSLEIRNAAAMQKIRRKYESMLVQDMLLDNFDNPIDLCISARSYGYELDAGRSYRVAVINVNTPQDEGAIVSDAVNILYQIIDHLDPNMLFTVYAGKIVLVFESNEQAVEEGFPTLSRMTGRLRVILGTGDISFCVSDLVPLKRIASAYTQARNISQISQRCGVKRPFITNDQFELLSLLFLLPENDTVDEYMNKYLAPLKQFDSRHTGNLFQTLQTWLDCGCNTKATAQKLYTHYNTITYRLDKIRRLLNMNLDDSEIQLQLRIAYKLDLIRS